MAPPDELPLHRQRIHELGEAIAERVIDLEKGPYDVSGDFFFNQVNVHAGSWNGPVTPPSRRNSRDPGNQRPVVLKNRSRHG